MMKFATTGHKPLMFTWKLVNFGGPISHLFLSGDVSTPKKCEL